MWKYHRCYGYTINRAFHTKKTIKVKWFVYIINRTLHGRLEIQNFFSRVEKIFHSFAALRREIFFTLEEKFRISTRPCNILYIIFIFLDGLCWKKRMQVGHTGERCILYEPLNWPNTEHVVTESCKYNIYHSWTCFQQQLKMQQDC